MAAIVNQSAAITPVFSVTKSNEININLICWFEAYATLNLFVLPILKTVVLPNIFEWQCTLKTYVNGIFEHEMSNSNLWSTVLFCMIYSSIKAYLQSLHCFMTGSQNNPCMPMQLLRLDLNDQGLYF